MACTRVSLIFTLIFVYISLATDTLHVYTDLLLIKEVLDSCIFQILLNTPLRYCLTL